MIDAHTISNEFISNSFNAAHGFNTKHIFQKEMY
jgi:hypothetical protein